MKGLHHALHYDCKGETKSRSTIEISVKGKGILQRDVIIKELIHRVKNHAWENHVEFHSRIR